MKLFKEEHDDAVAKGLCFKCKKPGHFANNCPDERTVAGSSGRKPPGKVSSFSVRIAPDVKKLRELVDTTESVDDLELGSCKLMVESYMIDGTNPRHKQMGDPLAQRVEHILVVSAPYPGNDTTKPGTYQRN